MRWKNHWTDPPEDVAIDVLPCSNGEYVPADPTPNQLKIMALQNDKLEETRRKFNMTRRDFVRTSAAYAIGVWAIDQVTAGKWGHFAFADGTRTPDMCDLENPGTQLANLPGEFILETQGHTLDSGGRWRTENPGFEFFLAQWTTQAMGDQPGLRPDGKPRGFGAGEVDWVENLSRVHYFKEMFLDSSTTVSLLTALPNLPDETNITPTKFAAETRDMANSLSNSERSFIHAFTMPNRGWQGHGQTPTNQAEDFAWMESIAGPLDIRGWKLYCGWGNPTPNQNGWWFDDDMGIAIVEHIRNMHQKLARPAVVCTHKGLAFNGTFDSAKFSPRDMGPIGRMFPDITFYTYHSGYDGELQLPYAGDDNVNSSNRGVDAFIKSVRENGIDAGRNIPAGLQHGNTPNMFAELGTAWWNVMNDANQATHLLGKLIQHIGPRRIVFGTDCIWYGNPQPQYIMLRALQFSNEAKELYNLPWGLEGDRFDPTKNAMDGNSYLAAHPSPAISDWPTDGMPHPERTIRNGIFGRNAADAYGVDADAIRHTMSCDDVQKMRDAYMLNAGTPKEQATYKTNRLLGPRNRREFWSFIREHHPWSQIPAR